MCIATVLSHTHTHTHTHPFSAREVEWFNEHLQDLLERTAKKKKKRHPFHHSSVGEESACSAGDPGLIPGLGRSSGEGIGYPLQYSWASLVAQTVEKYACNMGDLGSIPGLRRFPWRRPRLPTPVFLPGEFHEP